MVVDEHDRSGSFPYCRSKHLAGVNDRAGQAADRDQMFRHHPMPRIQGDDEREHAF
jgi:hypothetical protein